MKTDTEAVIARMKQALGLKRSKELAQALGGINPSLISRAIKTGKIPLKWYYTLENEYGIRRDFLETGEGTNDAAAHFRRDIGKKFATAIFSPDGQNEVLSEYPAAGIVTNASGLPLPIPHYAEYVLALEVRGKLDAEGKPQFTGSGLPLPRERLKRWNVHEKSVRSLKTAEGMAVFDLSQTEETEGRMYIVSMGGLLLLRKFVIGPAGPGYAALNGGQVLPATGTSRTQLKTLGRVFYLCTET